MRYKQAKKDECVDLPTWERGINTYTHVFRLVLPVSGTSIVAPHLRDVRDHGRHVVPD